MKTVKRNWDILTQEQRRTAIQEVINFFSSERDEQIGVIAAESILDMFLQTVGLNTYNKGVEDTKSFIKKRFEEIEIDTELTLKKFTSK